MPLLSGRPIQPRKGRPPATSRSTYLVLVVEAVRGLVLLTLGSDPLDGNEQGLPSS